MEDIFFGGDPSLPEAVVNILPPKSNLSLASHLSLSLSLLYIIDPLQLSLHRVLCTSRLIMILQFIALLDDYYLFIKIIRSINFS